MNYKGLLVFIVGLVISLVCFMNSNLLIKTIPLILLGIAFIFCGVNCSQKKYYTLEDGTTHDREKNPFLYWLWIYMYYVVGTALIIYALFEPVKALHLIQ